MFCKYCGNDLNEGANFCTKCGKIVSHDDIPTTSMTSHSSEAFDDVSYEVPQDPERSEKGGSILKFGILGLAFGCSFYISLLGLIFSIIARVKVKRYIQEYGDTEGKATVGKHLSVAGSIVSIISLCLLPIVIIALVSGILEGLGYSDLYFSV